MQVEGHSDSSNDISTQQQQCTPAAITDTGCERELNEDRYAVIESDSGVAWIVCDGMGGVTGGELAAQLAIDAIRRDLNLEGIRPTDAIVSSALTEANRIIVLRRQNQAFSGMGTTAVMAFFQGPEVSISHVGDSRAYLVRGGVIQQLTVDHTYVQNLVDEGEIDMKEALAHPDAHILTRCIGSQPGLELDVMKFWIWPVEEEEEKDYLILVTDGLYTLVDDDEIAEVVSQELPQAACARLVDLAKERGGFDNITVAIVPLNGQLRAEIPPDFDPSYFSLAQQRAGGDANDIPWSRWLLVAFLFAFVLIALIIAITFFAVSS